MICELPEFEYQHRHCFILYPKFGHSSDRIVHLNIPILSCVFDIDRPGDIHNTPQGLVNVDDLRARLYRFWLPISEIHTEALAL
jgi:hypothetical protein